MRPSLHVARCPATHVGSCGDVQPNISLSLKLDPPLYLKSGALKREHGTRLDLDRKGLYRAKLGQNNRPQLRANQTVQAPTFALSSGVWQQIAWRGESTGVGNAQLYAIPYFGH